MTPPSRSYSKICIRCGKPFVSPRSSKVYCSSVCQKKNRYAAWKAGIYYSACKKCGASFILTNPHKLYCSKECASIGYKNRKPRKRGVKLLHAMCLNCSREFSKPARFYKNGSSPKFCSQLCARKKMRGEAHPLFTGGPYEYMRDYRWRTRAQLVRERDEYRCVICGADKPNEASSKKRFNVDHIIPEKFVRALPWKDTNPHHMSNLISLCDSCHTKKTLAEKFLFSGEYREFMLRLKVIGYPLRRVVEAMAMFDLEDSAVRKAAQVLYDSNVSQT